MSVAASWPLEPSRNGERLVPTASRRSCTSNACTAAGSNLCGVFLTISLSVAPREMRSRYGRGLHSVKRVGQANDPRLHGNFFVQKAIRVTRAISALVMPAYNLRNKRPRKLNSGHNLMSDGGVIGHFLKFFGIKHGGFSEEAFIDRNFTYIVKISGRADGGDII